MISDVMALVDPLVHPHRKHEETSPFDLEEAGHGEQLMGMHDMAHDRMAEIESNGMKVGEYRPKQEFDKVEAIEGGLEAAQERWKDTSATTRVGKNAASATRGAVDFAQSMAAPWLAPIDGMTHGQVSKFWNGAADAIGSIASLDQKAMDDYSQRAMHGDYGVVVEGYSLLGDKLGGAAYDAFGETPLDHAKQMMRLQTQSAEIRGKTGRRKEHRLEQEYGRAMTTGAGGDVGALVADRLTGGNDAAPAVGRAIGDTAAVATTALQSLFGHYGG